MTVPMSPTRNMGAFIRDVCDSKQIFEPPAKLNEFRPTPQKKSYP